MSIPTLGIGIIVDLYSNKQFFTSLEGNLENQKQIKIVNLMDKSHTTLLGSLESGISGGHEKKKSKDSEEHKSEDSKEIFVLVEKDNNCLIDINRGNYKGSQPALKRSFFTDILNSCSCLGNNNYVKQKKNDANLSCRTGNIGNNHKK